ncbi:hypothetical protein B0H67DRAFT_649358 [Lasiosphaeris hirsuta]|uniref:Uncharacterized protein n=1 Tax=Lasiosphaeris hirsuta TaxID=260670 RepID=A0AA39ZWQ5_9PEZI|nr:hypothetical protein B0H67DRAFT_649358 [Lasiosphaeris hirsuta]
MGFLSHSYYLSAHLNDLEAAQFPREIILSGRKIQPTLTTLFEKHTIHGGDAVFAEVYPYTVTGSPSSKVIVIAFKPKKGAVFRAVPWRLALSLLLSIIVGLVVGYSTSSTSNGIQAGSGVLGVIALLISVPLVVVSWTNK